MMPSDDALINGSEGGMMNSLFDTVNFKCFLHILFSYSMPASSSCSQPHLVALDLNKTLSGKQTDLIRDCAGCVSSVQHTDLNFDTVTLSDL